MIVDSSALVAVFRSEAGSETILRALFDEQGLIPAPVLVEFERVVTARGMNSSASAEFLERLLAGPISVEAFTAEDAALAVAANRQHGSGNGRGGTLNLLDLMVYGMARRTRGPILCTGRDFAATGISIHPASRLS